MVYSHRLGVFNSSPNSRTVSLHKPQWAPKYFKLYALKNVALENKGVMECAAVPPFTSHFKKEMRQGHMQFCQPALKGAFIFS